jgi:hypothetical protein
MPSQLLSPLSNVRRIDRGRARRCDGHHLPPLPKRKRAADPFDCRMRHIIRVSGGREPPSPPSNRTFYGKEKKPLAYVIAIMNMILHGIEAPNIIHTNTQ